MYFFLVLAKPCLDPNLQRNSEISNGAQSQYHYTDIITIDCVAGFYLQKKNNVLKCIETGRWNGSFPECSSKSIMFHNVYTCISKHILSKNIKTYY